MSEEMRRALHLLLESEDNTGCSADLTVVAREPLGKIRSLLEAEEAYDRINEDRYAR